MADGGAVVSVADIVASVEASDAGAGNVLFVRFYEGDGAAAVGLGGSKDRSSEQRLQVSTGECWRVGGGCKSSQRNGSSDASHVASCLARVQSLRCVTPWPDVPPDVPPLPGSAGWAGGRAARHAGEVGRPRPVAGSAGGGRGLQRLCLPSSDADVAVALPYAAALPASLPPWDADHARRNQEGRGVRTVMWQQQLITVCLPQHAPHCLRAAAGVGNGCTARAAWLAAEVYLGPPVQNTDLFQNPMPSANLPF